MSTRNKTLDALKKFSPGKCRKFALWCAEQALANDFDAGEPSTDRLEAILDMAKGAAKATGVIPPDLRRACQKTAWESWSGMAKGVLIVALEVNPRQAALMAARALLFQAHCANPKGDLCDIETVRLPALIQEFEIEYAYMTEGE